MKNSKMIYSDYMETMMPAGFTVQKVLFSRDGQEAYKVCRKEHYTWNESDLLYYSDDTYERWYMDIPKNGAKTLTLKLGKRARTLVTLD